LTASLFSRQFWALSSTVAMLQKEATDFHRKMVANLFAMSPQLHEDRFKEAREHKIPLFRRPHSDQQETDDTIDKTTLLNPYIVYTYFYLRHCILRMLIFELYDRLLNVDDKMLVGGVEVARLVI
jgi:hypothetical protein